MLFDSGSYLNVIEGHDHVCTRLVARRSSPLQVLVDEEADQGP
jgi:hypothetical protein